MTVQARSQNLAYCAWTNDGRLHHGTFEVTSLSPVGERLQSGADGCDDSGQPCA